MNTNSRTSVGATCACACGSGPGVRLLRTAALVIVAVLTGACTTTPDVITLDGVVVEGGGLAAVDAPGLVRVVRAGQVIDDRTRMTLQPGDQVITAASAYAVIRYPSGTEVFMRPNTRGRVGSFTDLVGEVFAKIRGVFAVESRFVRAGADGTAYLVRTQASGETTVIVFDGQVAMSSLTGAWPPYRLPTGMMSRSRPQRTPEQMAAPQDELMRTRGWVERLETLVPEQRKVSAGETAAALAIGGLIGAIIGNASNDDERRGRDATEGRLPRSYESTPSGRAGSR